MQDRPPHLIAAAICNAIAVLTIITSMVFIASGGTGMVQLAGSHSAWSNWVQVWPAVALTALGTCIFALGITITIIAKAIRRTLNGTAGISALAAILTPLFAVLALVIAVANAPTA